MKFTQKLFKSTILTVYLALLIFASGCVTVQTSPVSGNKRVYGYSWQDELKLGNEADGEIIAQYGLYDNSELAEYVDRLGQELLAVSHFNRADTPSEYRNTPFTFRVLDSPIVNAFALPGGYVYLTRGLLAHLDNEAQLMVVLGHEIGHVAARHASQRAAEQQFGQLAIIGGAVIGESLGYDGGQILQMSGTTAQLLFLRYGRDDERESDQLGVEYSAMEGYVAAEGGKFFTSLKRISEKAGNNIPSHLSSHPDPGEREKNIPRMAADWEAEGYEMSIVNQVDFLEMIDGLMYGDNPRDGYVAGNTFYHPELEFQFDIPNGFQLVNQTSAVILFNETQDAIVQFTIDNQSDSPKASVDAFTSQEGITTESEGPQNVNGLEGHNATVTASTEEGTPLSILVSAVEYNGTVFRFLSYTSANQMDSYKNDFELVFSTFDGVNDLDVLNVQPVRIELERVRQSGIFIDLIPTNLPMGIEPLDVAILNQVELNDQIERGTILKIPVQ